MVETTNSTTVTQKGLPDFLLLGNKPEREDFLNSRMSERLFRYLLRLILENPRQFEDLIPLFNSFSQDLIEAYDTAKTIDQDPTRAEVTQLIEEHVNVGFGIGFSSLENGDLMITFAQNSDNTAEILYLYADQLVSMSVVEIVNKILIAATKAFPEYLNPAEIRHQLEIIVKFSYENVEFLNDFLPLPEDVTFSTLLNLYFTRFIIVSNDLFELINVINTKKANVHYAEQAKINSFTITQIMAEVRVILNKNEADLSPSETTRLKQKQNELKEIIQENLDLQGLMDFDFQQLAQKFNSIQTMLLLSMDLHEGLPNSAIDGAASLLTLSLFQAAGEIKALFEITSQKTNSLLSTALFQFRKAMENPELSDEVKFAQTLLVLRRLDGYRELISLYKETSEADSSNT